MQDILKLNRPVNWQFVFTIVAIIALVTASAAIFTPFFVKYDAVGTDLVTDFLPATRLMLSGQSPYLSENYFSLPWTLIPFIPFVLLPEPIAVVIFIALSFAGFGYAAHKLGAKPVVIAALLASPGVIGSATNCNTDFLVALGFVSPPWLALILVSMKPQLGAPFAVWIVVEAWRRGKAREVARVCAPVGVLFLASLMLYGQDMLSMSHALSMSGNLAPFPYLIPAGLVLLYRSLKNQDRGMAIAAAPCFTPYITAISLPIVALGLLPSQAETVIALLALWGVWIVRGVG